MPDPYISSATNSKQEMASKSLPGVIITVYQESSPSRPNPAAKTIKRPKFSRISSPSNAYDRRSRLLAYAHELRQPQINGLDWAEWNSRSQPKQSEKCGWRWKKFRISFPRNLRGNESKWKYERVETSGHRRRKRASGGRKNKFWGTLKQLLKGLSFGWKCNCHRTGRF